MKDEGNGGWWVYMLRCADNTLYTGITTDLDRRIEEHNNAPTGARYTRSRRPVECVYDEPAASRSEAASREAAIKQLTRAEKEALIGPGSKHGKRAAT